MAVKRDVPTLDASILERLAKGLCEDHELDEIMAARKAIWGLGPIAILRSGLRVHRMDVLIGTATVQPLNKKEGE